MYDNYTELKVESLTQGTSLRNSYILLLRETNGKRLLPILLDKKGCDMIAATLTNKDYTCSHLMNRLASRVGMTLLGARLMQPANGETRALIDFELVHETVSIQTSVAEATVATLEMRSSLWMQKDLFEKQANCQPSGERVSLPISALNKELIETAIKDAVAEDNFELASILRDELNRRKGPNTNEQA